MKKSVLFCSVLFCSVKFGYCAENCPQDKVVNCPGNTSADVPGKDGVSGEDDLGDREAYRRRIGGGMKGGMPGFARR